jgi:acyl carrier protein
LAPEVRVLRALKRSDRDAVGELATAFGSEIGSEAERCLQAAVELTAACTAVSRMAWVPVAVDAFRMFRTAGAAKWGRGSLQALTDKELIGRVVFWNKDGAVAAEVEGLRLRAAPRDLVLKEWNSERLAFDRASDIEPEWVHAFRAAEPGKRRAMLTDVLRDMIASHLGLPSAQDLPADTGLFESGLDSLAVVDIRNRLQRALGNGREVPIATLFNCPTPEALADFVVREFFDDANDPDETMDALVAEVQGLSEEHLDQSLREFYR